MGTTGPWCWWGWLETPPEEWGEIQPSIILLVMEGLVSFGAGGPRIWEKGGERLGCARVCVYVFACACSCQHGCTAELWGGRRFGSWSAAEGASGGPWRLGMQRVPSRHTHMSAFPVGSNADVSFGPHSHSCQAGIYFQEGVGAPPSTGLFVTGGAVLFRLQ